MVKKQTKTVKSAEKEEKIEEQKKEEQVPVRRDANGALIIN